MKIADELLWWLICYFGFAMKINMIKIIAMRGKPELIAIFKKIGRQAGNQAHGRSQSAESIIRFLAGLPLSQDTIKALIAASKTKVDVSEVNDAAIPSSIKFQVNVPEEIWAQAISLLKFAFKLQKVQMPYLFRVGGIAYLKEMETQNTALGIAEEKRSVSDANNIETFLELSTEEKLLAIYKLLLNERRETPCCQSIR